MLIEYLVLLFSDGCAILFHKLEELVNTIVANVGGTMSLLFEFMFKGEFCTLDSRIFCIQIYWYNRFGYLKLL